MRSRFDEKEEKEIEEKVEEIVRQSKCKTKTTHAGWTVVIDNLEELEKQFEIIRRVYKKRPFDSICFSMEWWWEDDT